MNFIHDQNRIYITDDNNSIAEVTFPFILEGVVIIDHTYVDASLRGQGVAGMLMEAVVADLRRTNRKARLSCSYAIAWFKEHPDVHDVLERKSQ